MTKKEMFAQIISAYNLAEEEKAFLEHEIELLNRKASKDRKPTAKQQENAVIKIDILNILEDGSKTCTEIAKVLTPKYEEISTNKVSALLKQMVDVGTVVRTMEKRKAYFSLAEQVKN